MCRASQPHEVLSQRPPRCSTLSCATPDAPVAAALLVVSGPADASAAAVSVTPAAAAFAPAEAAAAAAAHRRKLSCTAFCVFSCLFFSLDVVAAAAASRVVAAAPVAAVAGKGRAAATAVAAHRLPDWRAAAVTAGCKRKIL